MSIEKTIFSEEEQQEKQREYREQVLNLELIKKFLPQVRIEQTKKTTKYFVGDKLIGNFSEDSGDEEEDMFISPQTPEQIAVAIARFGLDAFKSFFPEMFSEKYVAIDPSGKEEDKFSLKSIEGYKITKTSPKIQRELSDIDIRCPKCECADIKREPGQKYSFDFYVPGLWSWVRKTKEAWADSIFSCRDCALETRIFLEVGHYPVQEIYQYSDEYGDYEIREEGLVRIRRNFFEEILDFTEVKINVIIKNFKKKFGIDMHWESPIQYFLNSNSYNQLEPWEIIALGWEKLGEESSIYKSIELSSAQLPEAGTEKIKRRFESFVKEVLSNSEDLKYLKNIVSQSLEKIKEKFEIEIDENRNLRPEIDLSSDICVPWDIIDELKKSKWANLKILFLNPKFNKDKWLIKLGIKPSHRLSMAQKGSEEEKNLQELEKIVSPTIDITNV